MGEVGGLVQGLIGGLIGACCGGLVIVGGMILMSFVMARRNGGPAPGPPGPPPGMMG